MAPCRGLAAFAGAKTGSKMSEKTVHDYAVKYDCKCLCHLEIRWRRHFILSMSVIAKHVLDTARALPYT
jgi:hypothetical protein